MNRLPRESGDGSDLPGGTPRWPLVVIGAGPAGVVAAALAAAAGVRVLLVEAKRMPRDKVCGGCLNQRALTGLAEAGLAEAVAAAAGEATLGVEILAAKRSLFLPTPTGLAITRRTLDALLIEAIQRRGVRVLEGTRASVLPADGDAPRLIQLTDERRNTEVVRADVVLAADGLGAPSLARLPEFATIADPASRVGLGAVLQESDHGVARGRVLMAVGHLGYVGMVCCEANRLNIAAAFDPIAMQRAGSVPDLVRQTLREAGAPCPRGLDAAEWRGTRPMTQRRASVGARRVLVVGDAAGYAEPFTGEGMAAAIEDAHAATPLVLEGVSHWDERIAARWRRASGARRRVRERDCRRLAWIARRPWATGLGLRIAAAWPALGKTLAQRISAPRGSFA